MSLSQSLLTSHENNTEEEKNRKDENLHYVQNLVPESQKICIKKTYFSTLFFYFYFFSVYLFLTERERETEHEQGKAKREGGTESEEGFRL